MVEYAGTKKLWLPYRGYWDTMLIPFPIIVLWQSAMIMKPISILPTHRYIRNSRLQTYFAEIGFKDNFYGIVPTQFIPALLTDSRVETLLKAGRTDHLRYFLGNRRTFEKLWQSYKIAVRNGYEIVDISLWSDYVDTLRRLGKDIHNPKYLCPTDLKGEHDRRHEELLRLREREEIEQKQQKAMEDEKAFQGNSNPSFFGICFTDGTIQVHVLESVQEHLEESVSMHHCVFSNAYYLKEDSLILSATMKASE